MSTLESPPSAAGTTPASNPFSTRFVRPGALPFVFTAGESSSAIVERLHAGGWRGQVVGPHGSGKTTLLHALRPEFEKHGREVYWTGLSNERRRLRISRPERGRWSEQTLVIVDGFEQIGWRSRRWLLGQCRRRGTGLLITAHRTLGLPGVYGTQPNVALARALADRLSPASRDLIGDDRLAELFQKHHGDIREVLFEFYDAWERTRGDRPF